MCRHLTYAVLHDQEGLVCTVSGLRRWNGCVSLEWAGSKVDVTRCVYYGYATYLPTDLPTSGRY